MAKIKKTALALLTTLTIIFTHASLVFASVAPKTGDDTNVLLWASIAGVAAVGFGGFMFAKSKKDKAALAIEGQDQLGLSEPEEPEDDEKQ
ncbi:MAG: LPXTG cell wall anchor domain-containing protein [Eubacteriaceae bacterium]|nr:LPXTG cell wall anchor domain-containing protein [Eubacteriaceae bacterium]